MKTYKKFMLSTLALGALGACSSLSFAPSKVGQTFSVRRAPDKIEVFKTQLPTKKYTEIGSVSTCCSGDSADLVDRLRKKASENGGDALIGIEPFAGGGISGAVIRFEE